jgi:hypothetical protein
MAAKVKDIESSPLKPEGLTPSVYNMKNPPKDWCDVSLLIPHEAIRMEMEVMAMKASVAALHEYYDETKDGWRLLYFSQCYLDVFATVIRE